MNLKDLSVGEAGRVTGFEEGARSYCMKPLAMGLTPGTAFTITRVAPLGDPVEIAVRGFKLSLRKDEAAALRVEKE
ncbi:MAG: FeoA family protein [Chromatiaceae bacterium]